MNTKQRKRQRDIKTKLMAAICMLLVSSIMMVSTTYAWFTLSTAPEVTGINTAVGANGALEMALLPKDGSVESITSAVGDSVVATQDKVRSNVTWGNLVDLEDEAYGLDKIQLMPSRLNIAAGKVDVTGYYLKTPVYGYDGRVSGLTANVVASAFENNKFLASNNEYGVRALGSATSMSARELGFRTFKGNANAARLDAQNIAGEALQKNGQVLANMAVAHVTGTDTFGATEKAAVQAIITAMIGEKGSVTNLEKALKNYVLMVVSSKAGQPNENGEGGLPLNIYEANIDKWSAMSLDELMSEKITVTETVTGEDGQTTTQTKEETNPLYFLTSQFTEVKTAKTELDAIKTNMNAAQTLVNGLTGDSYNWEQMRAIMAYMVNPDTMVVNGNTVPEISANNNLLINSYMETGKLEISLYNGSGVFADIARFCGNYDTTIDLKINFAGLDTQTTAQMYAISANKTETGIQNVTPHSTKILTFIDNVFQGAPTAETGAQATLTDLYGYIIDLAFRTNAADANLQLQTAAMDRIYSDNKDQNSETWGGGSYMTFKGATGFTNEQVKNLMDCINVVFFDKDDGTIYGIAKLDTENATENTSGVTARLFMMDYTINDGAMVFNGIKGSNIEYMTGTPLFAASEQNPATTAGAKVSVHVPEGMTINGNYHVATEGMDGAAAYTFTLGGKADRTDYVVTYKVGDAEAVKIDGVDGTYTIPVLPTGTTAVTIDVKAVFTKTALLTGDTDAENLAEVTEGNVDVTATIPVGVTMTGNSITTKYTTNAAGEKATGADYSFKLANPMNGATYTVTYKVGAGEEKLLTADANDNYTIPETEITNNVVITVKESRPFEAEGTITRLVQNEGKAVSALVYLDGDNITNADVANAASSMTGSMNLQFSTNVPLVPMEYTPLMGQTTEVPETTVPETTAPQNP